MADRTSSSARDLALVVLGLSIALLGSSALDLLDLLFRPGFERSDYVLAGTTFLGALTLGATCVFAIRRAGRVPPAAIVVLLALVWTGLLAS